MRYALSRFVRSEDGAVTVDWVVLVGAIVGLSIIVIQGIYTQTETAAAPIGPKVEAGVEF